MKHKITLELSTAELNALLNVMEQTLVQCEQQWIRGPAVVETAREILDEHEAQWESVCLMRPYDQLVAHWPRENTPTCAVLFAPSGIEGSSSVDCSHMERAVEMAFRIGQQRKATMSG